MAYLPMSEKEKEDQGQSGGQPGSEQVISSSSGSIDGSGSAAPNQSSGGSQKESERGGGSGWTNLQQYVSANQGADQRMGEQVEGHVGNKASEATNQQNAFKSNLDSGVASGSVASNPDVTGALLSDPTKLVKGGEYYDDWTKQYNATYQGPQDFTQVDGFSDAEKGTTGVLDATQRTGDFNGRQGLLDDLYGEGGYNAGEKRFDSFLIGAGEGGKKSMQNVQDQYGQFGENWENMVNNSQSQINAARTATQQVRDDSRSALAGEVERYQNTFGGYQDDLTAETTAASEARKNLELSLTSRDPKQVAAGLGNLGFSPQDAQAIINAGIDPRKFLGAAQMRSFGDFVSDSEQANFGALGELSGMIDLGYDFADSGLDSSKGFTLDDKNAGTFQDYNSLVNNISGRLPAAQAARDDQYGSIMNDLIVNFGGPSQKTLDSLGLSKLQYDQAKEHGLDFREYVAAGNKLTTADTVNNAERQQFATLLNNLGAKSPFGDLTDKNQEGSAWNFNAKGFEKDLLARLAAAEAKPAPTPRTPKAVPKKVRPNDPEYVTDTSTEQWINDQVVGGGKNVADVASGKKKIVPW